MVNKKDIYRKIFSLGDSKKKQRKPVFKKRLAPVCQSYDKAHCSKLPTLNPPHGI